MTSSTTIGSSTALTAGTLYRLGIRQSSGSGTEVLEAYLATGDTAFGTAFASSSAETISAAAAEIRLSTTSSSAVDATVDDIRLDTAVMPGPFIGRVSPTATPTNMLPPPATPTLTPTPVPVAPPAYDATSSDTIIALRRKPLARPCRCGRAPLPSRRHRRGLPSGIRAGHSLCDCILQGSTRLRPRPEVHRIPHILALGTATSAASNESQCASGQLVLNPAGRRAAARGELAVPPPTRSGWLLTAWVVGVFGVHVVGQ